MKRFNSCLLCFAILLAVCMSGCNSKNDGDIDALERVNSVGEEHTQSTSESKENTTTEVIAENNANDNDGEAVVNDNTVPEGQLAFVLVGESYKVSSVGECKDFDITIPSEYLGVPVTIIGYGAFAGISDSKITKITIPNTVVSIEAAAFKGNEELREVVIPDTVSVIGYGAFYDCVKLENVVLPEGIPGIAGNTFRNCRKLNNLVIPESVKSIGYAAFYGCESLDGIVIPNSVTSIGDYAFQQCHGLKSIEIPTSVKSLGSDAFLECNNLENVTYKGTMEEWNSILKDPKHVFSNSVTVHCTDGDIEYNN